jgi:type I site-specific restriction endonuclease
MDQRESHIRENIENTRAAMTEKIDMIEDRIHGTVEGARSSIDSVMENFNRVQGTVEEAKSAVDNILETIKFTIEETIEQVKYTTGLIEQVQRNPWIMFGSALLLGYVLSRVDDARSFDAHHAQEWRNDSEPDRQTSPRSFSSTP